MTQLFLYLVIVISAVFHEYAHGWVAYKLGDPTAKLSGRLTLNPLAHIDLFGTVIIPLLLLSTSGIFIGWAKPVPYNPYALKDPRYGSLKVAIAGPATNLLIALVLGLFSRFFGFYLLVNGVASAAFFDLLDVIIYINIFLALFNMIPFPPLDGSKVFADLFPIQWRQVMQMGIAGIFLALIIAFYFLPPAANAVFWIITGGRFGI